MPGLPRRGEAPKTSTDPAVSSVNPRMARSSEVLPEPFGPRIATNDGSNASDRSPHTRRPSNSSVARSNRTDAFADSATAREGMFQVGELGELPGLVGMEGGRDRLGDPDDRDRVLLGEVVDRGRRW